MNSPNHNSSVDQSAQGSSDNQASATGAARRENDTASSEEAGFVRFLVHELRNMLAPIRNAAHILRLRGAADANLRQVADIMERQIDGIGRLLNSLSEAERVKRGEATLELARVDLVPIVREALAVTRPLVDNRKQRVEADLPDTPLAVRVDAPRLTQVFASVIENAAKYSEEGSAIRLSVLPDSGGVEIRVQDKGRGITADQLPRIFDFYGAAGKPEESGKSGLGVSLAMARRLIELQAGRITVASGGAGHGSDVTIYLPLATEAELPPSSTGHPPFGAGAESTPRHRTSTSRRVLIVDDNADVRASLGALLQDLGHAVTAAGDGETALEMARDLLPEFVFLDVNMPKLSGVEVARRLRTRFPPSVMKLVMMSGVHLDEPTVRSAKRAGFDHCIDKIGDPEVMAKLLDGDSTAV